MKSPRLLSIVGALGFALLAATTISNPAAIAADASPVSPRATDGTGFQLGTRFNELYSGKVTPVTLTYAATTNVDFAAGGMQFETLTGNVTFTASNMVAGRVCHLILTASGGARNLTFPASWTCLGTAPTALASGKTGALTLRCVSSTAAYYSYQVQP